MVTVGALPLSFPFSGNLGGAVMLSDSTLLGELDHLGRPRGEGGRC